MQLQTALRKFDGKHTEPLVSLADRLAADDATMAELAAFAEHDELRIQVASTWILKRWVDAGIVLPVPVSNALVRTLGTATHWEVRLHLLQILSSTPLRLPNVKHLANTLAELVCDRNKFIRAWSYSALARLGEDHLKLRDTVRSLLDNADADDAPSVRARARQLRKQYKWSRKDE